MGPREISLPPAGPRGGHRFSLGEIVAMLAVVVLGVVSVVAFVTVDRDRTDAQADDAISTTLSSSPVTPERVTTSTSPAPVPTPPLLPTSPPTSPASTAPTTTLPDTPAQAVARYRSKKDSATKSVATTLDQLRPLVNAAKSSPTLLQACSAMSGNIAGWRSGYSGGPSPAINAAAKAMLDGMATLARDCLAGRTDLGGDLQAVEASRTRLGDELNAYANS